MSIRGIDTQIMVQRTADFVHEASAMHKHPQVAQETLANRNKAESVLDLTRVKETEEAEMDGIRADEEGGGAGGGGGGGQEQQEEDIPEEEEKELLVAPAMHRQIIDIMI